MAKGQVIALSGGVGGAKLALGLSRLGLDDDLLIVTNVGDDFEHLGLNICPDLDSVIYALAGLNDQEKGWGRADEGWRFMEAIGELGAENWFNLGDRVILAGFSIRAQCNGQIPRIVCRIVAPLAGCIGLCQHYKRLGGTNAASR